MQDALEVLVCGRIAHKISDLNSKVSPFQPQDCIVDKSNEQEYTKDNKTMTTNKTTWIKSKKTVT